MCIGGAPDPFENAMEVGSCCYYTSMKSTEAQLQTLIVNTLGFLGYTVIETGKARRKVQCPRCRNMHYPTGWQGNTLGCPDLYIHAAHWHMPVAVGIELKTKTGAVRKEQKCMADQQMTVICRDVESVIQQIKTFESMYGSPMQVERLERYLERNEKHAFVD